MAVTLTLQLQPCAGTHHLHVHAVVAGRTLEFDVTRDDLEGTTDEDWITSAKGILAVYLRQRGTRTLAELKTAIEAKTLNLTV